MRFCSSWAKSRTAVQRQNLINFTAPLFGDYVRRHHPLADLL
jgi:hypothetical protein